MPSDVEVIARVVVGFVLAFAIGFEREVRGSAAGDRTFALVGGTSAAITAVVIASSPQAVAGVITGVGFIGGGVVFHGSGGFVKGLTTAGGVFAAAGIGIVAGVGRLLPALVVCVMVLLVLELRYLPGLRFLDARRYVDRFSSDDLPPP